MSLVCLHSIIVHTHEVWRIIGPIPTVLWNIVSSLILHVCILFSYILSVMRVILGVLLTVDQSNTINIVILVIVVFVPSHD